MENHFTGKLSSVLFSVLYFCFCPDVFTKFISLVYIDMTGHRGSNEAVTEYHVSNLTDQGLSKDFVMKSAIHFSLTYAYSY